MRYVKLKEKEDIEELLRKESLTYDKARALEICWRRLRSIERNIPKRALAEGVKKERIGDFLDAVDELIKDGYLQRYGGRESYRLTKKGALLGRELHDYRSKLRTD